MKKIFAIVMTVAMILSMGTVFASAATRGNTPGAYVIGSKADFKPAEDIEIEWVADAAEKITFDGDLSDWANFKGTIIGPENMVSWVGMNEDKKANGEGAGVDTAMPKDWQITTYYLADPDYLYVGFYIVDDDVVATPDANYGAGDAFQINIDFGRKLGDVIEYDPDTVIIMDDLQNPFYSFGYAGDKVATVITRQRTSTREGQLNEEEHGVIAYTGKTTDGWCAEFRLPWEEMYLDYADKAWIEKLEDFKIYMGGAENKPLPLGIGLYYLNHSTNEDGTDTGINWAAGTHSGSCDTNIVASGAPIVGWDAYDTAITLKLMPQEGITFTSKNIEVLENNQTEPDTKLPSQVTEAWGNDEETDDPAADTTAAETTASETTAGGTTADTTAAAPADGCTSVLGASAAVVLAIAAAVVLKKKD